MVESIGYFPLVRLNRIKWKIKEKTQFNRYSHIEGYRSNCLISRRKVAIEPQHLENETTNREVKRL